MTRYPKYKKTGISWLPEIPEEWECCRTKQCLIANDGGVWGEDPQGDSDTIVLRSTEQDVEGNLKVESPARRKLSASEIEKALLFEGDLIITKSSGSADHIGKTSLIDGETARLKCCFSNFLQRLRVRGVPKFFWYLYNSNIAKTQFDILCTTTTGLKNLNGKIIGNVIFGCPPDDCQERIVKFLDDKCGKIDKVVAAKENEIELLRELKQTEIADAVTHGISGAPLVNSGIPWLPKIPKGWDVKKIRQHFKLRSDKVSEKDYPALSVAKIGVVPQLSDVAISLADGDTRKLVREGDYVVNSRSDRKGSCGIAPRDGSVTTISIVLEPRNIERKFVHYLFRSIPWVEEFYRNGRGIVADLWTTRYQEMRNMMFPYPPLAEQKKIVAHIEKKVAEIDAAVKGLEEEVAALKEYKQRLISDVVTGQVKV